MALERSTAGSSLVEVVDRILDKGIVIDAWISVSVIGIELVTIEARVIVASVETYMKYAEALKYIGPVAGGFLAEKQHKTLGEAVGQVEQGLSGLPLVGGQQKNEAHQMTSPRQQAAETRKSPSRTKSRRTNKRKRK